jgi:hypothetical protein
MAVFGVPFPRVARVKAATRFLKTLLPDPRRIPCAFLFSSASWFQLKIGLSAGAAAKISLEIVPGAPLGQSEIRPFLLARTCGA